LPAQTVQKLLNEKRGDNPEPAPEINIENLDDSTLVLKENDDSKEQS